MPEDTRRAVLSAAMEQMAPATETATPAPPPTVEPPSVTTSSEPAETATTHHAATQPRAEDGKFAKGERAEKVEAKPAPTEAAPAPKLETVKPVEAKTEAAPAPETPKSEFRAPSSFKPSAREKWSTVPAEVQAEIVRVDREVRETMQRTAEVRKQAEEFQRAAAPWEAMYRSAGMNATQALDVLSRSYYTLQNGSPQQKAQLVASLIQQSGLGDESGINLLASMLDGKAPQASAATDPNTIARQVEQRIQASLRQQAQTIAQERHAQTIAKFGQGHEFFEDVRTAMADILAARGIRSPSESQLEEVYTLACKTHPEISGVVAQREAKKAAEAQAEANRRSKEAASSVKSNPAGAGPVSQPKGRRAVLEAAWEEKIRSR